MLSYKNLKSPWALSFKNFVRAVQDMKKEEDDEWQTVEEPKPKMTVSKAAAKSNSKEKATSSKRALGNSEPTMQLEIDKEKEAELMTQVAILQRELDRVRGDM